MFDMFDKILNIIENAFCEAEKEKLEKETISKNQNDILEKMTCPCCHSNSFKKGYILSGSLHDHSSMDIVLDDDNYQYDKIVRICNSCGNVLLFADLVSKKKFRFK